METSQNKPKVNKILFSVPYGVDGWMPYLENYFFVIFLTDVVRMSAANMAQVMSLGSTLIAITAIISGVMIQKGNFKSGKYRPWILYAGIAAAVLKYMMFTNPGIQAESGLVIWFIIGYVGSNFGLSLTMTGHMALMPMIAHEPKERIKISALLNVSSTIAGVLFSAFSVALIAALGGGVASAGYSRFALLIAILVIIGTTLLYVITKPVDTPYVAQTKEEKEKDITKVSIWQMLKYSFGNGPMWLYLVGTTANGGASIIIAMLAAYYFTYVANNLAMFTVYLTMNTICGVIGSAITPFVSKLVGGNKNAFRFGLGFYGVCIILAYFANTNALFFSIALSIGYIGWAVTQSSNLAVFSGVIDYVEYKKGKDLKGFMMSIWTFSIKIAIVAASSTVGYGLASIGYDVTNVTSSAISGIRFLITIIPVIYLVAGVIGMTLFPISDEKHKEMQNEIAKRKNLNTAE